MRKLLGILLILSLIAGIFVSCSQDKVGNKVDEELVSVSFSSEGVSRSLTVSRETFDEDNYVWYYKSAKADTTGLTYGTKTVWTPVKPLTAQKRTGLSGATITNISQGLWNFELQAYVYNTGDAQDKDYASTGVAAWYGKVTNQSVRKDSANIVYVTVSAISGSGNGTIDWNGITGMLKLDEQTEMSLSDIVTAGMKIYVSATKIGATSPLKQTTIDSLPIPTGRLFQSIPADTYIFNVKVFSGTAVASADYIYADEAIAVNVYSGLKTIISGSVDELSSYVEFGEPVANAVIEAETPNIATAEVTQDVEFKNTQTEESTSFSTAVIKADAANAIRNTVIAAATAAGNTVSDLSLALNVEDKGSTDATSGTTTTTTKSFDISLTQIVTVTNDSTGVSTVTSSDVQSVSKHLVIDLYVGTGLKNFKAFHYKDNDDQPMTKVTSATDVPAPGTQGYYQYGYYLYNDTTGVVTLFVDSFSPFSVTYDTKPYVARVIRTNGTGADYYSLQEAFDAAGNGDTVALLCNLTESTTEYSIAKSISFDGNAYTINGRLNLTGEHISISNLKMTNPSSAGRCIDTRGNLKSLVLDDVDLLCTGTSGYIQPITIAYSGDEPNEFIVDVAIKDSTIRAIDNDGKYRGYAVILYTPVNLTIEDSDIEAWAAIYSHVSNATISVVDSKLVGVNENSSTTNDFATIVFDGNSLWDATSHIEDNSVTISGHSEIIAKENGTNKQRWLSFQHGATQCSADVIIESTTVIHDGTEYKNDKRTDIYWSGEGNSIKLALSDQQVTELRAKMFTVEELSTGYYKVTLIPNAWYSNGSYLTAPGIDTLFVKPLEEGWMDDNEGMKLLADITLVEDIACQMDDGSMYLALDGYSITGGRIIFDKDVCILCDNNSVASYFTCSEGGYQIVVSTKPDSNGFYRYSFIPVSGSGTETDPWLIYDYDSFQAVTQHYNDADFHYWKCVDDLVINATDWAPIYLYGSIKGNDVVLNNLDNALIRTAKNDRDENGDAINTVKVSDMTLNCKIHQSAVSTGLFKTASFDTVIENVKVSGVIEGTEASSYVAYGAGNVPGAVWNQTKFICSFINCVSDAHLIATSGNVGGFFDNPFCDVTGNNGVGNSLFIFDDSIFTGETSVPSGKKAKYFSYQGNALPIKVSYSDEFIALYGNPDGTCYFGPTTTREDGVIFVGNYPLAGSHSERSAYAAVDTYLKASGVVPSYVGTLPEKGEALVVDCASGANYAIVSFQVGPNDKDGHGNFVSTYMTERVSASGGKFTSDSIRYFDIAINPEGVEETGLVGNTFNIVNPSYGTTYGSANVLVIQYNSSGQQILSVTTFNLGTN